MCFCIILVGQIVVFLTNFAITLLGVGLTGIGVFIKYLANEVEKIIPASPSHPIVIAIIVGGVILMVLGLTGCIGSSCKVTWALIVNAIGISILAAAKLYLLILIGRFMSESAEMLTKILQDLYNSTEDNETLHTIEYLAKCCGVNGSETYLADGLAVPPTCCPLDSIKWPDENDLPEAIESICDKPYEGCVTVLGQYVDQYGKLIKTILIPIIAAEITTFLFDIIIACFGKRKR